MNEALSMVREIKFLLADLTKDELLFLAKGLEHQENALLFLLLPPSRGTLFLASMPGDVFHKIIDSIPKMKSNNRLLDDLRNKISAFHHPDNISTVLALRLPEYPASLSRSIVQRVQRADPLMHTEMEQVQALASSRPHPLNVLLTMDDRLLAWTLREVKDDVLVTALLDTTVDIKERVLGNVSKNRRSELEGKIQEKLASYQELIEAEHVGLPYMIRRKSMFAQEDVLEVVRSLFSHLEVLEFPEDDES